MIPAPARAALLVAAAIAAVACPLLVYSLSLASFGAAHVLVELKVLDVRWRPALRQPAWLGVAAALMAVFVLRCAANLHGIDRVLGHRLELLAGAAAVLAVVPQCWARSRRHGGIASIVAISLVLGLATSPLVTLLVLAVLHNLAPWPLVVAAKPPRERRAAWILGAIVFVAAPLLIATGLPFELLAAAHAVQPEATVLPTGPLFDQFSAFWGPSPTEHPMLALHVFSACAYLQCAHYVCVLLVLPGVGPTSTRVPGRWVLGLTAVGMVIAVTYAIDFAAARAWYGTLAGVHAWAEFPAVLLALGTIIPRPQGGSRD